MAELKDMTRDSSVAVPSARIADRFRLDGQVGLVAGASGGLGRAVTAGAAELGASLFGLDVAGADTDSAVEKAFVCDLTDRASVFEAVESAIAQAGQIDFVINCAGVFSHSKSIDEMDEDEWRRVFDVNFTGTRYLAASVLSHMKARGKGAFVAITSDSGLEVSAGESAYGIAKASAARLMAYLARENAHTGVRFNALAPGWIKTQMTKEFWSNDAFSREALKSVPVGRFADPTEIAAVALFLVSDLASYMNGHSMVVDGGRIAGYP